MVFVFQEHLREAITAVTYVKVSDIGLRFDDVFEMASFLPFSASDITPREMKIL